MITPRFARVELTELEQAARVAVFLDASERSASGKISTLVNRLLQALPASAKWQLHFLGNPRPYPSADFSTQARQWFSENQGRTRLLGPAMCRLEAEGISRLAIISTGQIFDIEDWIHPESSLEAAIFSPDNEPPPHPRKVRILRTEAQLLELIHDPLQSVTLSAPGLAPLDWRNPSYRLELDAGVLQLRSTSSRDLALSANCLLFSDEPVICSIRGDSGRDQAFSVPLRDKRQTSSSVVALTETESVVFRQAAQEGRYQCPYCDSEHKSNETRCRYDSSPMYRILGRPIYPSLEENKIQGLVVCSPENGRINCCTDSPAVVWLGDQRLLAILQGRVSLLDFVPSETKWQRRDTPVPRYTRIDGGRYVLTYR